MKATAPQHVRVITGTAGGLWLKLPKGFTSRATQDKVRQALFSILGGLVIGARVMDLYAGSGSLGIEALSRGAASTLFIENDRLASAAILDNLTHTRLEERGRVLTQDAILFLQSQEKLAAELILLDPPYTKVGADLSQSELADLLADKTLQGTWIVWEHAAHDIWSGRAEFEVMRHARYGKSQLLFLKRTLHSTHSKKP